MSNPSQIHKSALEASKITLRYGGLDVLKDVNFSIQRNEVVGLIGPNGAGKSALLNCISRVYQPEASARIAVAGDASYGQRQLDQIARFGVSRTFQGLQLSSALTVRDNIAAGLAPRLRYGMLSAVWRPLAYVRETAEAERQVLACATRCGVADVLDRYPAELPLGVLRRVDLARALVSAPQLLLLDEPASGLAHQERPLIAELIELARQSGDLAVVWVEHDLDLVFSHTDRVVVLRNGETVAEGRPSDGIEREQLIASYYG